MNGFRTKNLDSVTSLGERLQQARNQLGLSLTAAAQQTKISGQYLQALEAGAYQQLPGPVYARIFLKIYGQLLQLEINPLLNQYQSEQKILDKLGQKNPKRNIQKPVEKVSRGWLVVTPRLLRYGFGVLLALALVAYLGFKIQGIFAPPFLTVSQPANDLVTEQKIIEIIGQAEAEAIIKINGQQVLSNQAGNFSESLSLRSGTNIIEITAQKKHSQPVQIYRRVIVIEAGN